MEPAWSPAVTARHTVAAAVAALAVVVIALGLWKLRVVLALILLGLTIAAAIRPGVDRLASWRVPRAIGVVLHYAAFLGPRRALPRVRRAAAHRGLTTATEV
jgi:predicted PurR-regulated permease PerM